MGCEMAISRARPRRCKRLVAQKCASNDFKIRKDERHFRKSLKRRSNDSRCKDIAAPITFCIGRHRVVAGLLAVVDESLGVGGDCALDGGIIAVFLRDHPLGVDVSSGE